MLNNQPHGGTHQINILWFVCQIFRCANCKIVELDKLNLLCYKNKLLCFEKQSLFLSRQGIENVVNLIDAEINVTLSFQAS